MPHHETGSDFGQRALATNTNVHEGFSLDLDDHNHGNHSPVHPAKSSSPHPSSPHDYHLHSNSTCSSPVESRSSPSCDDDIHNIGDQLYEYCDFEEIYDNYGYSQTREREHLDPDSAAAIAGRSRSSSSSHRASHRRRRPRSHSLTGYSAPKKRTPKRPMSAFMHRGLLLGGESDDEDASSDGQSRSGSDMSASKSLAQPASLRQYSSLVSNEDEERRGWGGSLINGAVNAAVFSAAVGLTAYRMWKGWGRNDDDDDGPVPDDDGASYIYKSPTGIHEPVDEHLHPPRPYPIPSRPASLVSSARSLPVSMRRVRRKRALRPSIADLAVAATRQSGHKHHQGGADQLTLPAQPGSPATSIGSMTTAPVSEHSKSPMTGKRSLPEEIPEGRENGESASEDEDDETSMRLDEMSRRLLGLIAEAERALASKSTIDRASDGDGLRSTMRDKAGAESGSRSTILPPASTSLSGSLSGSLSRRHSSRPQQSVRQEANDRTTRRSLSISSPASQSRVGSPHTSGSKTFPSLSPINCTSASSSPIKPTLPGSKGPPPREAALRDRRTSSGNLSSRGLPPLPWRRDPSGSPRWVQRALSPSPERRSATPVPPVPPIPPELAHAVASPSRSPSVYTPNSTSSTKRFSAPPLKLSPTATRRFRSASSAMSSPLPPASPNGDSSPTRSTPPRPRSPDLPVTPSPSSPRAPSRIPRHVRSQSLATRDTDSPPMSPSMHSRPFSIYSHSASGVGSVSGGSRALTPITPRKPESLDWRGRTPTTPGRWPPSGLVAARAAALSSPAINGQNGHGHGSPSLSGSSRPRTPGAPAMPSTPSSPTTPASTTGSGRSRIPVRRSIDPDAFSAFGRCD